jgi:hypothetical protein
VGSSFITNALASAHKTLDDVNKSSVGTKSGHTNFPGTKPAPAAAKTDYSHVRAQRPGGDSFMGVKADQGTELKAAEQNREAAKQVLNQ